MIPETRSEQYLASIIGEEVELPVPQSRIEHYLNIIAQNGVAPSSAGLINYDPDASYPDGSIGKEVHDLDGDVSELKSAIEDVTERGPNILPVASQSATVNDVAASYADGKLTLVGTASASGGRLTAVVGPLSIPAGTYTFSRRNSMAPAFLETGSTILAQLNASDIGKSFTVNDTTSVYVGINVISGEVLNTVLDLQLETGSSATAFVKPSYLNAVDLVARATLGQIVSNSTHILDLSGVTPLNGYAISGESGSVTAVNNFSAVEFVDISQYAGNNIIIKCALNGWAGFALYDKDGTFVTGENGNTHPGDTIRTVTLYVPVNASYLSFSMYNNWSASISDYPVSFEAVPIKLAGEVSALYKAQDKMVGNILAMFDNITCCGDSLTYSQVYTAESSSRQAYVPYPKCIEKLSGATVTNLAVAGYTAINWWGAYANSITEKANHCAIIYLGTNAGFTDTLSTDAPENTSYETWADTNTGCLAKAVAKFLDVGARVILIKNFATTGNLETTNDVIEQVADRFGCGLVGPIYLAADAYHYYPDKSGKNPVHYNDIGYAAFANKLIYEITNMDKAYLQNLIPS